MSRYIRELFEHGALEVLSVEGIYQNDPMLFEVFRKFIATRYAAQNLLFFEACMRGDSVETLVKQFFTPGARHEANIPAESRDEVLRFAPAEWRPEEDRNRGYMSPEAKELDLMSDGYDSDDDSDSDDEDEDVFDIEDKDEVNVPPIREAIEEARREIQTIIDRNFMTRFQMSTEFADYCLKALGLEEDVPGDAEKLRSLPGLDENQNFEELAKKVKAHIALGGSWEKSVKMLTDELSTDKLESLSKMERNAFGSCVTKIKAAQTRKANDFIADVNAQADSNGGPVFDTPADYNAAMAALELELEQCLSTGSAEKKAKLFDRIAALAIANGKSTSELARIVGRVSKRLLARSVEAFEEERGQPEVTPDEIDAEAEKARVAFPAVVMEDEGIPPVTNEDIEDELRDLPPPPLPTFPLNAAEDDEMVENDLGENEVSIEDLPPPPPLEENDMVEDGLGENEAWIENLPPPPPPPPPELAEANTPAAADANARPMDRNLLAPDPDLENLDLGGTGRTQEELIAAAKTLHMKLKDQGLSDTNALLGAKFLTRFVDKET